MADMDKDRDNMGMVASSVGTHRHRVVDNKVPVRQALDTVADKSDKRTRVGRTSPGSTVARNTEGCSRTFSLL